MSRATKIQPEQIEAARKLLQALPVKETAKSKQEAAASLTKEFRQALKNGYTAHDISELLKREGVAIPMILVKACTERHKGLRKNKEGSGKNDPTAKGNALDSKA